MVWFIGAGPGDVELLTVKARRLIGEADVILYAGSLVNPAVLAHARPDATILDTAHLRLDRQVEVMVDAARAGRLVARLHTGDPSVYGALHEQTTALAAAGVPFGVVPGVSSAFAAAAALGLEYTLPEITQTVILTRMAGRTPVPPAEELRALAAHRSSLVVFLSTGLLREVVDELVAAGYGPDAPVALVYRASWPDEQVVRGTVGTIADLADEQELTHQGLIIVSPALASVAQPASHLYGGYQEPGSRREGTAVLALTVPAIALARTLASRLPGAVLHLPERLAEPGDAGRADVRLFRESVRQALQGAFAESSSLVCVMAAGIVVRELAPLLGSKHSDPAVVVVDARGAFAVSLLGGHEGGANRLAREVAGITGGQAVVTTASDGQGIPALDVLARDAGWAAHPRSRLAAVMAATVNGEQVGVVAGDGSDWPADAASPSWVRCDAWQEARDRGLRALVLLTTREPAAELWGAFCDVAVYHPRSLVVGVGCNRGTPASEIRDAVTATLRDAGLAEAAIACLATVTAKAGEPGLVEAARDAGWPLEIVSAEDIRGAGDPPNPSAHAQRALGVPGVAEPAAMLVAGSPSLLVPKRKFTNVTVAVAMKVAMTRETR